MDDKQRTERFRQTKEMLEEEDYGGQKRTVSVLRANVMAFVTAGPVAVFGSWTRIVSGGFIR